MIRVALLGPQFAAQVRTNAEELRDLQVVWVGDSLERFRAEVPALKPRAVVLDIADLPQLQPQDVRGLVDETGAELALVTYGYATRAFLRELRADHLRVLPAPLALSTLRAHLAFLMVQELLGKKHQPRARTHTALHPVGCRCPDELEHLVSELLAAEARERSCGGRGTVGEALHQKLDTLTQEARATLQRALASARVTQ